MVTTLLMQLVFVEFSYVLFTTDLLKMLSDQLLVLAVGHALGKPGSGPLPALHASLQLAHTAFSDEQKWLNTSADSAVLIENAGCVVALRIP